MANSHTQFSIYISIEKPEEFTWWTNTLIAWNIYDGVSKNAATSEAVYTLVQGQCDEGYLGWEFSHDITPGGIVLYTEDDGNVEQASQLIHLFLKEMGIADAQVLTWASTCDKPRPDEFCGGTVYITKEGVTYMGPDAQLKALEAANAEKGKWTLQGARELIAACQYPLSIAGWSVGLTGSVLYEGASDHDLDLITYPMDNTCVDYQKLWDVLASLGWIRKVTRAQVLGAWARKKSTDDKYVEIYRLPDGRRVNVFVLG